MKALYFDCFSGISGDMALGALLDLGADERKLREELSKMELAGYELIIDKKTSFGITGTDVTVLTDECDDEEAGEDGLHAKEHEQGNGKGLGLNPEFEQYIVYGYFPKAERPQMQEDTETAVHEGQKQHSHSHRKSERNLRDIIKIIDESGLNAAVKYISKDIFTEIARAEAKVHGKSIDEVHFHEVGAVDSIVDIVAVAICIDMLGIDRVYSSALHDGTGFIQCAHGTIPVPVPAVSEMLSGSGIPLVAEDIDTELVTPTGMGIIKKISSGFGKMPPMSIEATGFGIGKRETGRLNALRVFMGEIRTEDGASYNVTNKNEEAGPEKQPVTQPISQSADSFEEVIVLETNIDDTTSEILGYASERLLAAGALDVFYTPIYMKKNRPAYMLTVISKPGEEIRLSNIIFAETSTLGVRKSTCERRYLYREIRTVKTQYGEVRIKCAAGKTAPEYEDCRRIAEQCGLPLAKVYEMVMKNAAEQYGV